MVSSLVPELFKNVMNTVRGGGKLAPNLPFELEECLLQAADNEGLWSIHTGRAIKPDPGTDPKVTIFIAELSQRSREGLAAVRANIRRLKTLRQPNILRYLADHESETQCIVVTERVYPFLPNMEQIRGSPEARLWLLNALLKGVNFLNFGAGIIHGNLRPSALFLTQANELRIGGFELSTSLKDPNTLITSYNVIFREINFRDWPPEIAVPSRLMTWDQLRNNPVWSIDTYMIARLLISLFPSSEMMPPEISAFANGCLTAEPRARVDYRTLLDDNSRMFRGLKVLEYSEALEKLNLLELDARESVFADLLANLPSVPLKFRAYKVAPLLRAHILTPNVHLTTSAITLFFCSVAELAKPEFEYTVLPVVKYLFAKDERHIRLAILDSLSLIAANLEGSFVQEAVYQRYISGFTDSFPAIREATLKASIFLAPKLSSRQLNGELLRFYARLQADQEPGIRANTTICLGYVAKFLEPATRGKILGMALVKSLNDPFGPSRRAGLSEIAKCIEYFDPRDITKNILPLVVPLMIDEDEENRDKAWQLVLDLVERVRNHAISLLPEGSQTVDKGLGIPEPSSSPSLPSMPVSVATLVDKMAAHSVVSESADNSSRPPSSSPLPARDIRGRDGVRADATERHDSSRQVSTTQPAALASSSPGELGPKNKPLVRTSRPMVLRKERPETRPDDNWSGN